MCGIAGYWREGEGDGARLRARVERMAKCLEHRGPDACGTFADEEAGLALGHRRLSILDLSDAGSQPMRSHSGRFALVINGEIYNHAEIREALPEQTYCGHSDTEVLLAAIERWGLEVALQRSVGMFALALWDRERRTLSLARDRIGEKPLYYAWAGRLVLFGSELKALRGHPEWYPDLDTDALHEYVRYGYVPEPRSIYRDCRKLTPGTILTLRHPGEAGRVESRPYWRLAEAAGRPAVKITDAEAVEEFERQLRRAVRGQMVADVPVGAFLSGGIDSSVVTATMQAESRLPVRTYTIGFAERDYDESAYARAVAQRLGTEHTELRVGADQAREAIPALPRIYDEPFADPSQIPTLLVARLARTQVTVALTGDGGDELLAGYRRYGKARQLQRYLSAVPVPTRRLAARLASSAVRALIGGGRAAAAEQLEAMVRASTAWQAQAATLSRIPHPERLILPGVGAGGGGESGLPARNFVENLMYFDCQTYLPSDILVKMDRAAMAVALETRVPLLDHRLVEYAWSLPFHMKVRNGRGKWMLRQVVERHLPANLFERRKQGFDVPMGEWLRGPLRAWAEDLLSPDRLRAQGLFRAEAVEGLWRGHLNGADAAWQVWIVLAFQGWIDYNRESGAGHAPCGER